MLMTSTNGHKKLHGIQLAFSTGVATPLFKGADTGQEENFVLIDVDPSKVISGISMKSWEDDLTGLRMIDEEGNYIVDYTWQPHEETGSWSETKHILAGQSIIGLVVNKSQATISRLVFLFWIPHF